MNDLLNINIEKIAKKGKEIYEEIKNEYEPRKNGKYLAIETDAEKVFIGETTREAVNLGKERYPDSIFYVLKIGYDAVEEIARLLGKK